MSSINKVILLGNLTRDPELKYLESGTALTKFGLAVNRNFKLKNGETQQETCFVDVKVWGRQAETAAEYLSKGSHVAVVGRLEYEQWETKDGNKRSKVGVVGEEVTFMGKVEKKEEKPAEDVPPEDDVPF